MFVGRLISTNPNTLDEHSIALVPTFSSLETTMCWLGNFDKNDFSERYDLMSVVFTIRTTPLWVCQFQKFHYCQSASGNPRESSEFVLRQFGKRAQQGLMLNCASESSQVSQDHPPCVSPCLRELPLLALHHTSTVLFCGRILQLI